MDEFTSTPDEMIDAADEMTVGSLCESIETNMWLADAYMRRGSESIAIECLREAWMEYLRFRDILRVYAGDDLGCRLVTALAGRLGAFSAGVALGPDADAADVNRAFALVRAADVKAGRAA